MAQVINTNIASLTAQRNLAASQKDAASAMERLSSGLRINSAKDDAAGLAISNRLTSQINGINQAIRNANDGLSVAQVAEGALAETTDMLQRMRTLSVQAANASLSDTDRTSLQAEVTELNSEINRIATSTSFGETKLLNGSYASQNFQVGANVGETLSVSIASAKASDLGSVNTVTFGNENTFVDARVSQSTGESAVEEQVLTFTVGSDSTTVDVADNASAKTIAADISSQVSGVTASAKTTVQLDTTTGLAANNTVTLEVNGVALAAHTYVDDATLFDYVKSSIEGNSSLANLSVTETNTTATITDADGDDISIKVTFGTGTGTAIDGAEGFDITSLAQDGSTEATTYGSIAIGTGETMVATGDIAFTSSEAATQTFNVQSNVAIASGGFSAQSDVAGSVTTTTTRVDDINISTVSGANTALSIIDSAIASIDSQRASLGAVQSRFDSVVSNLSSVSENSSAARSRIMDADFAAETAALAKNQVLQQAGISVLAQANAQPQNVLALLQ